MPPEAPLDQVFAALRRRFSRAGLDTAALDARLLIIHALGVTHADLVAGRRFVSADEQRAVEALAARRLAGETVARIVGAREFYGRSFRVTTETLEPRPDTEILIDTALSALALTPPRTILDLGTGSGILIVTLLAAFAEATGVATDISAGALDVAKGNARLHGVSRRVSFQRAAWLDGVDGSFDLVVSNPPYIPHADIAFLAREVREGDPIGALDGGADGLDAYRAIAAGIGRVLQPGGLLLLEIGHGQAASVDAVFRDRGFAPAAGIAHPVPDLAGRERVVAYRRKEAQRH